MLSEEEIERYKRQIRIDKIGAEGQDKIKNSSVLIVGAGGLGSPILLYLTGIGVGKIGIVYNDILSLSNLTRQILYRIEDIGKKKVLIAKERLQALNPNVIIEAFPECLDATLAKNIFPSYDSIIDATDNFETRYLINRVAVEKEKPLFIGAVGRFTGQVMSVMPHKTSCYNCVFPEKDEETVREMSKRNEDLGVIGTIVGTIGSIVANEFIKHILNIGSHYFNKLLIMDLLNNDISAISISRDPRCRVCGNPQ